MVPEGARYSGGLETDQSPLLVGVNVVLLVSFISLTQHVYWAPIHTGIRNVT